MDELTHERLRLIEQFNLLEKDAVKDKKQIILDLSKNLDKSLKQKRPDIMNQLQILSLEPDVRSISTLIKRIRDKNNWSVSDKWIELVLPAHYKRETKPSTTQAEAVYLSDNYLKENADIILSRIKDVTKGPAKDIKVKERIKDVEEYDWACHFAQELVKLAINMEKEHEGKHDKSLCSEYAKRAKSTRDRRFATSINNYEAIIIGVHASTSLKNAIAGEWEFLTRWDIQDNEIKCTECLGHAQCEKEKCGCVCHRVIKPMTTKGLKYAIKTNEYLKDWDKQIQRLTLLNNDICRIGKVLLEYKKTEEFLDLRDKKKLIFNHIERDECLQCEIFLEKHPKFFEKNDL